MTRNLPSFKQRLVKKALRMTAPWRLFTGHVLVNPTQKLVYFAIPKCANSSLKSAFLENLDVTIPPEMIADIPAERLAYSPLQSDAVCGWLETRGRLVHRAQVFPELSGFQSMAVLRDPVARARSCWKDKIAPTVITNERFVDGRTRGFLKFGDLFHAGMSFEAFVEAISKIPDRKANPHFRSQADFIHDNAGKQLVDTFFFVETLNTEIAKADPAIRACFDGLGQKNTKSKKSAPVAVPEQTRALLRQRYEKDYDLLRSLNQTPPFELL